MSTLYRPQQNGLAERTNRTIVMMIGSLLHGENLNKAFWTKVVANVVYIQNQCPTRTLDSIALEEAWSHKRPYTYLCVLK